MSAICRARGHDHAEQYVTRVQAPVAALACDRQPASKRELGRSRELRLRGRAPGYGQVELADVEPNRRQTLLLLLRKHVNELLAVKSERVKVRARSLACVAPCRSSSVPVGCGFTLRDQRTARRSAATGLTLGGWVRSRGSPVVQPRSGVGFSLRVARERVLVRSDAPQRTRGHLAGTPG
jgi:hypothetical protein